MIGKAERLADKDNPRFIVTTLQADAQTPCEKTCCARGDMENRIKEQQLELFAERLSSASFAANQQRLWMSVFAHCQLERMRAVALKGSELAKASAGTIRLKLLKICGLSAIRPKVRFYYVSTLFYFGETHAPARRS